MNCKEASQYLQAYIDGEFDESEARELVDHFKFCPHCKKRVEYEQWFKQGLKGSVADVEPPKALRAKISGSMRTARRRETPIAMKLTPAVAILLAFVAFYFMPQIEVKTPIVEATVDRHVKDLPADVQSNDYAQVKRYLQTKINHALRIPRFTKKNISLLGGRVDTIHDSPTALVTYESNGRKFSIMASPMKTAIPLLPENIRELIDERNDQYVVTKHKGFNVVLWKSGEMLYSLTSDDSENHLVQLVASADYD